LRQKRKWSKILHNLRINPHLEKSTTLCKGLHIISDIPHPTICTFQPKPTKIAKPNLRHITSHTTMLQPILLNPPPVAQITYPTPNNTNPQVKTEANPPPPPPQPQPQAQETPQQPDMFPTHGTILTITGASNTNFETKI
jgi:hypothetical protein